MPDRERDLLCVIHGDDFTILGWQNQLDWFWSQVQIKFEAKHRARLGPAAGDEKQVRILNQIITWTDEGIEYEGGQRHSEICISNFGLLADSRSVSTPVDKTIKVAESEDGWLVGSDCARYRAIIARMNYLGQDRSDIQYAIKELSSHMANNTIYK